MDCLDDSLMEGWEKFLPVDDAVGRRRALSASKAVVEKLPVVKVDERVLQKVGEDARVALQASVPSSMFEAMAGLAQFLLNLLVFGRTYKHSSYSGPSVIVLNSIKPTHSIQIGSNLKINYLIGEGVGGGERNSEKIGERNSRRGQGEERDSGRIGGRRGFGLMGWALWVPRQQMVCGDLTPLPCSALLSGLIKCYYLRMKCWIIFIGRPIFIGLFDIHFSYLLFPSFQNNVSSFLFVPFHN